MGVLHNIKSVKWGIFMWGSTYWYLFTFVSNNSIKLPPQCMYIPQIQIYKLCGSVVFVTMFHCSLNPKHAYTCMSMLPERFIGLICGSRLNISVIDWKCRSAEVQQWIKCLWLHQNGDSANDASITLAANDPLRSSCCLYSYNHIAAMSYTL